MLGITQITVRIFTIQKKEVKYLYFKECRRYRWGVRPALKKLTLYFVSVNNHMKTLLRKLNHSVRVLAF
jgi:hypothetical protein